MKPNKLTYLYISLLLSITTLQAQKIDSLKTDIGVIKIQPILHSSFVLTSNSTTIYIDPHGGSKLFASSEIPDIILITDIHGDHLDLETLESINTSKAIFITPKAVADKLPEKYKSKLNTLNNGQGIHRLGLYIRAVPMYNLPETDNSIHPKGRGNGYLLLIDDKRIYISGDTEDIQEMRTLKKIDIAFVCMNLPYTMDIYQASSAVLEFQPKIVYPYHYRGKDGFSNVKEFKNLVNLKNSEIEVRLAKWYPKN